MGNPPPRQTNDCRRARQNMSGGTKMDGRTYGLTWGAPQPARPAPRRGANKKAARSAAKRNGRATEQMDGRTYGLTWGAPQPARPSWWLLSLRWSAEWTQSQSQLPLPPFPGEELEAF